MEILVFLQLLMGLQRMEEISLQGRFLEVSNKCSNLAKIRLSKIKTTHSAISHFISVVNFQRIQPQFPFLFVLCSFTELVNE